MVLPFSAPPEVRLTMLHLGPHLAPYPVPDRASAIASLVRTSREQLSTGYAAARPLELQMWRACWALDHDEAENLLNETLDEESDADKLLTTIATGGMFKSGVNQAAAR